MNTPRTDEASGPSSLLVDRDFARQLETELREAKSQVNDLNNLLRHAGWGQGEIDSASSLVMELEESQAREAQLRWALERVKGMCEFEGKPITRHGIGAVHHVAMQALISKHPDLK